MNKFYYRCRCKVLYFYSILRAHKRLALGFCPLCNSDAPELYDCPLCKSYAVSYEWPPTKETKTAWMKEYQVVIDAHLMVKLLIYKWKHKKGKENE